LPGGVPDGGRVLPGDGNRLVDIGGSAPLGPTGGVCPVCGQGYDPGVTVCPKHHESLVPALVLAERRRAPTVGRKICPVCGHAVPGDSDFCGKCGAALVPVN
jgi:predicted amidophosphoribosyltransferase